jgi:2-haloacid dehalogenase
MSSLKKFIVFDTVGTLVGYDAWTDGIEARLGDRLHAEGVKPLLFGFAWIEAAEREYTYFSISGKYLPFLTVFDALFYHILHMASISSPRSFAAEEDKAFIIESF